MNTTPSEEGIPAPVFPAKTMIIGLLLTVLLLLGMSLTAYNAYLDQHEHSAQVNLIRVTGAVLNVALLIFTWGVVWFRLKRWRAAQASTFAALAQAQAPLRSAHAELAARA